jgi:hypothetical protein
VPERRATACDDGAVAAASVVGAICGHGADVFVVRDLVQQVWQDGAVAIAAGREFHGADVRGGCVHGQMNLAPPLTVCRQTVAGQRLTTALNAMLARLPLAIAIAEDLDPGAVHEQVQRPIGVTVP